MFKKKRQVENDDKAWKTEWTAAYLKQLKREIAHLTLCVNYIPNGCELTYAKDKLDGISIEETNMRVLRELVEHYEATLTRRSEK